jgi:hypothetical protein
MKEKTTYNPQDIEDLLLNKSFDELHSDEREFVLTHVEDEVEYKELRNTLLSVKQIAAEQESIYVPNRIKEDLMQLMEKKKKPLGWFNLNSIGAFLFPSNTPLFKKPGLQLVTAGLMLLFVVNIGTDFVNQPKKELAVNTNHKVDKEELVKEDIIEKEPELREEIIEKVNANSLKEKEQDNLPTPEETVIEQSKIGYFDVSDRKLEEIVENRITLNDVADNIRIEKPKVASVPVLEAETNRADNKVVVELDEEITVAKDAKGDNLSVTLNTSTRDLNNVVSLNSVVVTSEKLKKAIVTTKLKSQNLGANSDVIDLLFVAL